MGDPITEKRASDYECLLLSAKQTLTMVKEFFVEHDFKDRWTHYAWFNLDGPADMVEGTIAAIDREVGR